MSHASHFFLFERVSRIPQKRKGHCCSNYTIDISINLNNHCIDLTTNSFHFTLKTEDVFRFMQMKKGVDSIFVKVDKEEIFKMGLDVLEVVYCKIESGSRVNCWTSLTKSKTLGSYFDYYPNLYYNRGVYITLKLERDRKYDSFTQKHSLEENETACIAFKR
ncbi:hypothetical protein BDF21DRAFT_402443 [Thamnidium elegans]|nr:hypothetical protein BDF21DRAFT_402443 [Thamnidium elegans]